MSRKACLPGRSGCKLPIGSRPVITLPRTLPKKCHQVVWVAKASIGRGHRSWHPDGRISHFLKERPRVRRSALASCDSSARRRHPRSDRLRQFVSQGHSKRWTISIYWSIFYDIVILSMPRSCSVALPAANAILISGLIRSRPLMEIGSYCNRIGSVAPACGRGVGWIADKGALRLSANENGEDSRERRRQVARCVR